METMRKIEEAILRLKADEEKWRMGYQSLATDIRGMIEKNSIRIKNLEVAVGRIDGNASEFTKATSSLSKEIRRLSSESAALAKENTSLRARVEENKKSLRWNADYAAEAGRMEAERLRKDLEKRLQAISEKIDGLDFQKHEGIERLVDESLKRELRDVYSNIGTLRKDLIELRHHKDLIEKTNARIDSLDFSNQTIEDVVRNTLKKEVDQIREGMNSLLAELIPKEKFLSEVERLSKRIDDIEFRQQPDIEGMIRERLKAEKQRIDLMLSTLKESSPKETIEAMRADMESRLGSLEATLKESSEPINAAIGKIEARLSRMESRADSAERQADEIRQATIDALNKRTGPLKGRVDGLLDKVERIEASLADTGSERARLSSAVQEAAAGISEIEERLSGMESFRPSDERVESLEREIRRLDSSFKAGQRPVQISDERLKRIMEEQLGDVRARVASVEEDLKAAEKEMLSEDEVLDLLENHGFVPATAGDSVPRRMKEINEHFDNLARKIDGLEGTVQRIREEKSGKTEEIEDRISKYNDTISEINGRISSVEAAVKESFEPMMDSLRLLSEKVKKLNAKEGR